MCGRTLNDCPLHPHLNSILTQCVLLLHDQLFVLPPLPLASPLRLLSRTPTGNCFLLAQASFVEFNNRMNEYFSIGCGCAMKMAQCPDAVR